MKIYIEIVIALVLLIIFICWKIWFYRTQRKLLKNYNPDDDKARPSRNASERVDSSQSIPDTITDNGTGVREEETREQPVERTVVNDNRPYQSERYKFLSSESPR